MRLPKPNSIEPPRYGPVCPVVWEGRRREAPPYPDQSPASQKAPPLVLPAVTASQGSCLDHLEIRRQAQAVGAAAQVSFQRFLRAEMHDVAEARIDKNALHLSRLVEAEPWLLGCARSCSQPFDECGLVAGERRERHDILHDH